MSYLLKNYKTFLLYFSVFILLFLSSVLIRNSETRTLFLIFGYALRLLCIVLPIYFYYKKQYNNYFGFVLLMAFYNDVYIHLILIVISVILFNRKALPPLNTPYKFIYVLFVLSIFSFLLDQFKETNILSFPIYIVTFFLPTILYGIAYNYSDRIDIKELFNFFNSIVLALYAVIYLQILIYGIKDPDIITGGTAHPHFAAVFISISFLISVFAYKTPDLQDYKWKRWTIILLYLPTMYFIDAKYILMWVIVSVVLTVYFFILNKWMHRLVFIGSITAVLLSLFLNPNFNLPISHVAVESEDFRLNDLNNRFKTTQKYEMIANLISLPKNDMQVFLIGAGPGTFLSQASNLRMPKKGNEYFATLGGQTIKVSKFFAPNISWVKKKYGKFFLKQPLSSSAFSDWRSSYLNMVFELGITGLIVYILFYLMHFIHAIKFKIVNNRKYSSIILAALSIIFLLLPFMELWSEYHNYLIVSMTFLGLLSGKLSKYDK
jgi:hypothetical protein